MSRFISPIHGVLALTDALSCGHTSLSVWILNVIIKRISVQQSHHLVRAAINSKSLATLEACYDKLMDRGYENIDKHARHAVRVGSIEIVEWFYGLAEALGNGPKLINAMCETALLEDNPRIAAWALVRGAKLNPYHDPVQIALEYSWPLLEVLELHRPATILPRVAALCYCRAVRERNDAAIKWSLRQSPQWYKIYEYATRYSYFGDASDILTEMMTGSYPKRNRPSSSELISLINHRLNLLTPSNGSNWLQTWMLSYSASVPPPDI
jgi:hypothetical protein